jgi:hypothetical protein
VGSAVAVLALLFDLLVIKSYYTHHTKDPFRQFTERVLAAASDGRSFVVWAEHAPRVSKLYFVSTFVFCAPT